MANKCSCKLCRSFTKSEVGYNIPTPVHMCAHRKSKRFVKCMALPTDSAHLNIPFKKFETHFFYTPLCHSESERVPFYYVQLPYSILFKENISILKRLYAYLCTRLYKSHHNIKRCNLAPPSEQFSTSVNKERRSWIRLQPSDACGRTEPQSVVSPVAVESAEWKMSVRNLPA